MEHRSDGGRGGGRQAAASWRLAGRHAASAAPLLHRREGGAVAVGLMPAPGPAGREGRAASSRRRSHTHTHTPRWVPPPRPAPLPCAALSCQTHHTAAMHAAWHYTAKRDSAPVLLTQPKLQTQMLETQDPPPFHPPPRIPPLPPTHHPPHPPPTLASPPPPTHPTLASRLARHQGSWGGASGRQRLTS